MQTKPRLRPRNVRRTADSRTSSVGKPKVEIHRQRVEATSGCIVDYSEAIHKRVSRQLARHFKRKLGLCWGIALALTPTVMARSISSRSAILPPNATA